MTALRPCISQATTLSTPFEADLSPIARGGFDAVEVWLTKLEKYLQSHSIADAKSALDAEGLSPLAASGQGGLLLTRGAGRDEHWSLFRRRLEWLGELRVPLLVIAADAGASTGPDDLGRAVESLGEACDAARSAGVALALEFQKGSGVCACLETALSMVAAVGSPNLGVCLDLFHYYTGPSKFDDLAGLTPENLAWVQVSDLVGTPREVAGDSDRVLPGDGDFRLGPIFDHLASIGYAGGVSLELLNPSLWAIPADRVADFGHQAVTRVLGPRARVRTSGDD